MQGTVSGFWKGLTFWEGSQGVALLHDRQCQNHLHLMWSKSGNKILQAACSPQKGHHPLVLEQHIHLQQAPTLPSKISPHHFIVNDDPLGST